jgi:nitrogenase molybdenum-iron protein beta chain
MPLITEAALSREEKFKDRIFFQTDGGIIQQDIINKLRNSKKAVFLGSGWEKFLAQQTNNVYAFISMPMPETVVCNKSYTGYNGGLALTEEIYSNVFKTRLSFSTLTASEESEEKEEMKEPAHAL